MFLLDCKLLLVWMYSHRNNIRLHERKFFFPLFVYKEVATLNDKKGFLLKRKPQGRYDISGIGFWRYLFKSCKIRRIPYKGSAGTLNSIHAVFQNEKIMDFVKYGALYCMAYEVNEIKFICRFGCARGAGYYDIEGCPTIPPLQTRVLVPESL